VFEEVWMKDGVENGDVLIAVRREFDKVLTLLSSVFDSHLFGRYFNSGLFFV
jgi:hypothetical protein